jgi:predicted DNA-binding transcriptional regulator YafY
MRTYRISRMQSVTPLAATFERPHNFKLSIYWETSTRQLQEQRKFFDAVIAADLKAAQSLRNWCVTSPSDSKRPKSTPKDWQILKIRFEDPEQARFIVLGFGTRARVLEPAGLREQILAEATAILGLKQPAKPIA